LQDAVELVCSPKLIIISPLETVSWAAALVISVGCLSPSTTYFSLFSVNPAALALRYNAGLNNTRIPPAFSQQSLTEALAAVKKAGALPELYLVGMSGQFGIRKADTCWLTQFLMTRGVPQRF
jgi:hypothetical protein